METSSQSKKPMTVLAVLSLIGVGLALQLTMHYYDVRGGMAGFRSFCNISAHMNCDAVAASPYAEFAGGIPLSSFAAGWYLALFLIALIGRNRFWRREVSRLAFVMTSFGVLFSLAYFAIMAFRIHTYCLFCLCLDAVAILAFLAALWTRPEGLSVQKPEKAKWTRLGATLVGCVLVAVIALKLTLDNVSIPNSEITQKVSDVLSSPVLPQDVAGAAAIGPESAPVTIVEFSDFQCPYCRIGAMVMNTLMERYPAQVRVVFKPFPLDASCNRIVTQPMHQTACEAARTALCADRQGKFKDTYETLFEHQTQLVPGMPAKMAQNAGVDPAQLASCVNGPEVSQAVAKSIEEGIQLGVEGTPTFFVNGHKVEALYPAPFWEQLVEKLLQSHQ